MTVDQILTLINAGYTKSEIEAMSTAPAVDPAPAAPETPEQKPQPAEAPPAAAEAKPEEPAPKPASAPQPEGDAQRILKALGDLAKGVDVPPAHELTIEEKLGNTILAAMGMKLPKEDN